MDPATLWLEFFKLHTRTLNSLLSTFPRLMKWTRAMLWSTTSAPSTPPCCCPSPTCCTARPFSRSVVFPPRALFRLKGGAFRSDPRPPSCPGDPEVDALHLVQIVQSVCPLLRAGDHSRGEHLLRGAVRQDDPRGGQNGPEGEWMKWHLPYICWSD